MTARGDAVNDAVHHPDPEINAGVAAEVLEAERADLAAGYPPRTWICPDCGASHSRGHFMNVGQHRCLRCGYVGSGGVMVGPPDVTS
jgi:rubredoxin